MLDSLVKLKPFRQFALESLASNRLDTRMTRLLALLDLIFGINKPIRRGPYVLTGLILATLKYAVEAFLVYEVTGNFYSPLEFISPLFSQHAADFKDNSILAWGIFLGTLPFLWVALNMSVRRAIDTEGMSPWIGLLVLLPGVNLLIIAILAVTPSSPNAYRHDDPVPNENQKVQRLELSVISAILAGLTIGALMMLISVFTLGNYGTGLFIGTPIVMGTTSSYFFNRKQRFTILASMGIGLATVGLGAIGLLLFALEGLICVVMAVPLILPLGIFGALLGFVIAEATREENQLPHISAIVVCLPLFAGLETFANTTYETVVMTSVEIDAPPEEVWDSVIAFPEIDTPQPWYFRIGIASPLRAKIDGHGVGATRHCEFTTGEFVEPITIWNRPHHLAFNVTEQPDPLVELSPYRNVHPPHLDGYMRSNRGEFRLVALANGRTRLEGRTWYEIDMFPQGYWVLWSDMIIHRIHLRVLEHIRRDVER